MLRMIPIVLCGLAFDGPLEFEVASVRPIPPPMVAYNTSLQITPRGFDAAADCGRGVQHSGGAGRGNDIRYF